MTTSPFSPDSSAPAEPTPAERPELRRPSSLQDHHARHRRHRFAATPHATPKQPSEDRSTLAGAIEQLRLRVSILQQLPTVDRAATWVARQARRVSVLLQVSRGSLTVFLPRIGWHFRLIIAGTVVLLALLMALARSPTGTPAAVPQAIPPALQAHVATIWERADLAVQRGEAQRGWTWGPAPFFSGREPYAENAEGTRLVQYYDKGRLEINDPDTPYAVTAGLLVREMVAGQVMLGDDPAAVEPREPAQLPVAGDPAHLNPTAPTYASFQQVASLATGRPARATIGDRVVQTIDREGRVGRLPADVPTGGDGAIIGSFDATLQHNIPNVFWRFLQQTGTIYEHGQARPNQPVYPTWQGVPGLPLTEPYWIRTNVAGRPHWVLVQLFERRVLTYTPGNPPAQEVELGNAGQHYFEWRYGLRPWEP